ncbi:hypothetical protein [Myroides fluvii]|uniref:hypothetical protein n=1 Tax=Myroides fluvii TaxID=2572594 RepID=UPI00131CA016|nr:hypothetical protein [Myroides fluvii]
MKKKLLHSIFLFSFFFTLVINPSVLAQAKKIEGDTLYWNHYKSDLQHRLALKDFKQSTDDFNFRLWMQGQLIEINKRDSLFEGFLIHYTYHTKKLNNDKKEIIQTKTTLPSTQSKALYHWLQQSPLLDLPSDHEISTWRMGCGGITYEIEQASPQEYKIQTYWNPEQQDAIVEKNQLLELIHHVSNTLDLEKQYTKFKDKLPRKGCYTDGESSVSRCFISNSMNIGLKTTSQLPYGFHISYQASYLGNRKLNTSIGLDYSFDTHGFYSVYTQVAHWNVFYKKSDCFDFFVYTYQNRKLNDSNLYHTTQNHQLKYGITLKNNYSFGMGIDYLQGSHEKIGAHFYAFNYFSKLSISTIGTISVFDNDANYKLEVLKSIALKSNSLIHNLSIGAGYSNYFNYKTLSINTIISL